MALWWSDATVKVKPCGRCATLTAGHGRTAGASAPRGMTRAKAGAELRRAIVVGREIGKPSDHGLRLRTLRLQTAAARLLQSWSASFRSGTTFEAKGSRHSPKMVTECDQRRALRFARRAEPRGCTEAVMRAHGFTLDLLTDWSAVDWRARRRNPSAPAGRSVA